MFVEQQQGGHTITRRKALRLLAATSAEVGLAARALLHIPISLPEASPRPPAFETGSILQANILAEPFYFRSQGFGVYEIGHKFADAIKHQTGGDVHPLIEKVVAPLRRLTRPQDGICDGVASYATLKRGPVPETSSLGGIVFDKDQIMTLGGLLHFGDAPVVENYWGDQSEAGFLHYMLGYLAMGEKIIIDTANNPQDTFKTPVDIVWIEEVKDSPRYQGWSRVNVTLRMAGYLDPGFQHPGWSRGDPGFRYHSFVYDVDNLQYPGKGEYRLKGVPVLSLSRPDPNRFWVYENGAWVTRSLDDNLSSSELVRLKAYQIQGPIFTRTMIEMFNLLAGDAKSLTCLPQDRFCRP